MLSWPADVIMQAVRERAADVGQFAAVHALLRGYWGALSAAQRPLGLLQGGPSAPSVVRGGPTLGLLRPAGAAAAHAAGLAVPGHPAPSQVSVHCLPCRLLCFHTEFWCSLTGASRLLSSLFA